MSTIYGNIANQFPTTSPSTGLDTNITPLNATLDKISNQSNKILTEQEKMQKILDTENGRLESKRSQVDSEYSNKVRQIFMNDNLQKKYNAYLKITIVFICILVIIYLINILSLYFPIIPSILINILYVIIFSGGVIYSIMIYNEIQRHDQMDFDKLKFRKPDNATSSSSITINDETQFTSYTFGMCGEGTYYDQGTCRPVKVNTFTTKNNELQNLNTYEYTNYSFYSYFYSKCHYFFI